MVLLWWHNKGFSFSSLAKPQSYLLRSVPIGELVGTAVGTSGCDIGFGAAWHIVDEGDEVVDDMRIVYVVILGKEFRPVGDALRAEVRAAIPR